MLTGNAVVGQSGGPTAVINASLLGVVETAVKSRRIGRVFGMRFGIEGVLSGDLLDFGTEAAETLQSLKRTPGSALGSTRLKLNDEHFPAILKQLKRFNIRFFFMIGGNDTMDTIHRITEYTGSSGYQLIGVGVSVAVGAGPPQSKVSVSVEAFSSIWNVAASS